jgi:AcrR family transcriptional regulator
MTSDAENKSGYQNHRDRQIENILDSAKILFIEKGMESVTMQGIAHKARISRNTLYNYFPNKQEVAYGIFQRFIAELPEKFSIQGPTAGTGYMRLEKYMMGILEMVERNPEDSRFIAEFNVLYARDGDPQRMRQMYAGGDDLLVSIIRQGIADGSIRADFDPGLLFAVIYNFFSAVNLRFSLTGSLIAEEYGQPINAIIRAIFRIFLEGLHAASAE